MGDRHHKLRRGAVLMLCVIIESSKSELWMTVFAKITR